MPSTVYRCIVTLGKRRQTIGTTEPGQIGTCTLHMYLVLATFDSSHTKQQRPAFSATIRAPIRQVSQTRLELPHQRKRFIFLPLLAASVFLRTCDCACMIRDDSWPCDTRTLAIARRLRATLIIRRSCPEVILKHSSFPSGVRHVARPDQSVCAVAYSHQHRARQDSESD